MVQQELEPRPNGYGRAGTETQRHGVLRSCHKCTNNNDQPTTQQRFFEPQRIQESFTECAEEPILLYASRLRE